MVVTYMDKLERIKVLRESIKNFNRDDEVVHFDKMKKEHWTYTHPNHSLISMTIQLKELLDDRTD